MERWEYEVIDTRHVQRAHLQPVLNEHGAEGWELVTASFQNNVTIFVFKRRQEPASSDAVGTA